MSGDSGQEIGFSTPRSVVKKVLARQQSEGEGAVVRRSVGRMEARYLDPFLMLDEFTVTPPAGFPDHFHRGFETVTYMLQELLSIKISPEMRERSGPVMRRIEPRYLELLGEEMDRVENDGMEVCVIAGESMGVRSPVYTRTPTMYLDFTLKPGAEMHPSIPESWNAFIYILDGEGMFGSENSSTVLPHNLLVLGEGDRVRLWNKSSSKILRFILIAGQPLNEPVVQHGPFVMNTSAQIEQTIRDYYYGKNGFEMANY